MPPEKLHFIESLEKQLGKERVCFISHFEETVHQWGEVKAGTQGRHLKAETWKRKP